MHLKTVLLVGAPLLAILIAGCAETARPPPMFRFDSLHTYFEDDMLVVNFTFTNIADITLGNGTFGPRIHLVVYEETAVPEPTPGVEPEDTQLKPNDSHVASVYVNPTGNYPRVPRYYDVSQFPAVPRTPGDIGPTSIAPGENFTIEFGFILNNQFRGSEGYYTVRLKVEGAYPRHYAGPYDSTIPHESLHYSACFNYDTPRYYGVLEGKLDCRYWDETGWLTWDMPPVVKENTPVGQPLPESP